MSFTPSFVKGGTYTTRSGKSVTILEEIRDSKHFYDCVVGDDYIARYDRPDDVGRVTGQCDPYCPNDLIPNP